MPADKETDPKDCGSSQKGSLAIRPVSKFNTPYCFSQHPGLNDLKCYRRVDSDL